MTDLYILRKKRGRTKKKFDANRHLPVPNGYFLPPSVFNTYSSSGTYWTYFPLLVLTSLYTTVFLKTPLLLLFLLLLVLMSFFADLFGLISNEYSTALEKYIGGKERIRRKKTGKWGKKERKEGEKQNTNTKINT